MVYKGCRRCRGDLYEEEFLDATDLVCLQCGDRRPLIVVPGREDEIADTLWLQSARPSRAA